MNILFRGASRAPFLLGSVAVVLIACGGADQPPTAHADVMEVSPPEDAPVAHVTPKAATAPAPADLVNNYMYDTDGGDKPFTAGLLDGYIEGYAIPFGHCSSKITWSFADRCTDATHVDELHTNTSSSWCQAEDYTKANKTNHDCAAECRTKGYALGGRCKDNAGAGDYCVCFVPIPADAASPN